MKNLMILVVALLMPVMSLAHEGHEMPGVIKSLYGGTVKSGKIGHMEYSVSGAELKIYPRPHEGEKLASDLTVSAQANPKKGASYPLILTHQDKFYSVITDLKGANRLPVEVTIKSGKLIDKFIIQIEAE